MATPGRNGPETWVTEEVPGVPEGERYYIFRHGGERPGLLWQGPTKAAAEQWARDNGVTIDHFDPFEP